MEQLLESGGRRLEQVDQRSEGREDYRSKEKDQDQPAAGDGAEHVGQIDEHEAGAALVQLLAGHRHGGDDDQGGQQSGHSVKDGHHPGVRGNIGAAAEVGAVDQGAVSRYRKGKEGLPQGIDPHHWVQQPLGVQDEDVLIARSGSGQGEQIDGQPDEEDIEQGGHDLVGQFDSTANAES